MPVQLYSNRLSDDNRPTPTNLIEEQAGRGPIRIGLVNNMPEAAFKATENQFISLLNAACDGLPIQLSLHVLRGVPMTVSYRHAASLYGNTDDLRGQRLDGLIVTGAEPTTTALQDEPYWTNFTRLLDWARDSTASAIWSCLAAHAAVLHMDGIERRRNDAKHFGIFQCQRLSDDRLLHGTARHLSVPHSRWNGLDEQELAVRGYNILSRTQDGGVDMFAKQETSLFVFLQGHPEYSTDTLLREYRRDIGRFLHHDAKAYPNVPQGYFDAATETAFSSLKRNADSMHRDQILAQVARIMPTIQIKNTWQSTAVRIYRNWLKYLCVNSSMSQQKDTLDVSRAAC